MKKNFMKVASLLIVAMLMVVSCSQEVAPKNENNGLVEASLSVGYGRNITVSGKTDADGLTVQYKMTPQWTDNYDDEVTNPAVDWTVLEDGNLGWLTPGYWKIEVKASKDSKDVFAGNVSCYFTKNSTGATVYLEPVNGDTNDCSITITVSMQEIKETVEVTDPDTQETSEELRSYKLQYEILSGTGNSVVARTDMDVETDSTNTNKIVTYSNSKGNLAAGFYTAIVYVVDANNQTVGGIRNGFLLTDGDNATLTGHIEPADYSNVTINAVYVDVNIGLVDGEQSITEDGDYQVVVTATDSTRVPSYAGGFSKTYIWYVDGEQYGQVANSLSEANPLSGSQTLTFENPGYKNIACQAVYKSNLDNSVYFTEMASIYVLVNPTEN